MITELTDSPDADVGQLLGRHRPHQTGGQSGGAGGQSGGGGGGDGGKSAGRGGQQAAKATSQALTGERGEFLCIWPWFCVEKRVTAWPEVEYSLAAC